MIVSRFHLITAAIPCIHCFFIGPCCSDYSDLIQWLNGPSNVRVSVRGKNLIRGCKMISFHKIANPVPCKIDSSLKTRLRLFVSKSDLPSFWRFPDSSVPFSLCRVAVQERRTTCARSSLCANLCAWDGRPDPRPMWDEEQLSGYRKHPHQTASLRCKDGLESYTSGDQR